MFEVGFTEIILILGIALLVLGSGCGLGPAAAAGAAQRTLRIGEAAGDAARD